MPNRVYFLLEYPRPQSKKNKKYSIWWIRTSRSRRLDLRYFIWNILGLDGVMPFNLTFEAKILQSPYRAVSYCLTVNIVSSMVLLQSVLTDDTKKFKAKISCWPFLLWKFFNVKFKSIRMFHECKKCALSGWDFKKGISFLFYIGTELPRIRKETMYYQDQ